MRYLLTGGVLATGLTLPAAAQTNRARLVLIQTARSLTILEHELMSSKPRTNATNLRLVSAVVVPFLCLSNGATAQKVTSDIPYVENGHERHVLDIYTPEEPAGKSLPVMFWIHGGGWQMGDKSDVALKPKVLIERGFVFVSTNYRLLPEVAMEELIGDVARSLGWVHKNIAEVRWESQPDICGWTFRRRSVGGVDLRLMIVT